MSSNRRQARHGFCSNFLPMMLELKLAYEPQSTAVPVNLLMQVVPALLKWTLRGCSSMTSVYFWPFFDPPPCQQKSVF